MVVWNVKMPLVWLVAAGLLLGCQQAPATPPPRPTPFQTDVPLIEAQNLPITDLPAAQSVRLILAQQLQLAPEDITILSAEETSWRNTCLGLPAGGGRPCEEIETPGYLIVAEADGEQFTYRTDTLGAEIRLEAAPNIDSETAPVQWQGRTSRGCWRATITLETVAFGPCDAEMMPGSYAQPIRMQDLQLFIDTYTSFEAETTAGRITFQGAGEQTPTATDQRMIAEWAQVTASEAEAGQGGAAFGAALVWSQQVDAQRSNNLQLFLSGEALTTICSDNACDEPIRFRIQEGDLFILYDLVDTYQSFETGLNAPSSDVVMVFTGSGDLPSPQAERDLIEAFAEEIYRQTPDLP